MDLIMGKIKTRDAELSKEKIINAAKVVFAEKGFHKTTLSEIGEKSGLSRTTPSYFYKNKENLYKAVIDTLISDEKKYVSNLKYSGEITIDSLKDLLHRHIDYTFKHPYLSKIIIWESLNEERQEWIHDYFPDMFHWSYSYLNKAQECGLIRDEIDTYSLWLNAMAMAWLPIITEKTFMKSINREINNDRFLEFHKKQIEMLIFESIQK
jgi:AcrR family transcriptional regulator